MKASAICSVKGGVGKTLVTVNIAHKLSKMGYNVGLLDADLDNSNFAQMTQADGRIEVDIENRFKLYDWNGIKVFSMSLLAGREKSVSMTGDRFAQISDDAIRQSDWGDINYYIIDMPGGSSDVFKAYMTFFAENYVGSVIVSQPAMVDATRKVLNLHKYFEIPVLGLIENMSYFTCKAHKKPKIYHPFGESTVDKIASEFDVEVLGKIPLNPKIPNKIAKGNPFLQGEELIPIEAACKKIIETPVQGTSFLERFKAKITGAFITEVEKVLATLVNLSNKRFNIKGWASSTGFTQQKPFDLVITDETETKALSRVHLKLKEDKLVVLKKLKRADFEAHASFKTLARMVMGKQKLRSGKTIPYSAEDAWLNGDFKVYGVAHTPRVIRLLHNVFSNEEIMSEVRSGYRKLLVKWI